MFEQYASTSVIDFVHDGKSYRLFVDRAGERTIYVVKKDGSNGRVLTLHDKDGYATPRTFALLTAAYNTQQARDERNAAKSSMTTMYHRVTRR